MIEIRIRTFFKAEDGVTVVPSTTLLAPDDAPALNVAARAKKLVEELADSPLGALRPMTAEEVEAYCADEDAEEAEGCFDLGLSDDDLEPRS